MESGELFHFCENPSIKCPVGKNIHNVLDKKLYRIQTAMENEIKKITLADVISNLQLLIDKKNEE